MTRMELMLELNKWDHNNFEIAKRHAETMIELLQKQFLSPQAEDEIKRPRDAGQLLEPDTDRLT